MRRRRQRRGGDRRQRRDRRRAGTSGSAGTGGSIGGSTGTGGVAGTGGSTAGDRRKRGGWRLDGGTRRDRRCAGTGGSTAGRGGTGGVAGTAALAGTGGVRGHRRRRRHGGGVAGTGGNPCTGTPGSIPSLSCCTQYDHAAPSGATTCDSNNTYVFNVAFLASGNTCSPAVTTAASSSGTSTEKRRPIGNGAASFVLRLFRRLARRDERGGGNAGGVDIYTTNNWTKQRTLALTTTTSTVYGVAFAPDSQRVFSIDGADRLHLHSISNVTALNSTVATVYSGGGTVSGVVSVPPTQLATGLGVAVSGSDGDVSLYSVTGTSTFGTEVVLLATDYYNYVTTAFSPNGTLLAVGDWDSFGWFWNFPVPSAVTPPTGTKISIGSTNDITDSIYGMAFSPNGQYIAITGGYNQGSVQIWNVSTRTMVSRFNLPATLEGLSVAFSPNGSALVVGVHGCGKVFVCSTEHAPMPAALSYAIRGAAVAVLAIGAACGKHKESLIVVNLTTATPITNPGPVTLTVGSLSREYPVAALSSTPVCSASTSPENVTGTVDITARVATRAAPVTTAAAPRPSTPREPASARPSR